MHWHNFPEIRCIYSHTHQLHYMLIWIISCSRTLNILWKVGYLVGVGCFLKVVLITQLWKHWMYHGCGNNSWWRVLQKGSMMWSLKIEVLLRPLHIHYAKGSFHHDHVFLPYWSSCIFHSFLQHPFSICHLFPWHF